MLSKIFLLVIFFFLQTSALVDIKLKQSTTTSVQILTDLSSNWSMKSQCLIDIPNVAYNQNAYWGIYTNNDYDSLYIGAYYQTATLETILYLFENENIQTDVETVKDYFKSTSKSIDSINSYIRVYKHDSIYVGIVIPSTNQTKIYKNYRDSWRLIRTISASTLEDFRLKNDTAYFASTNKLHIISGENYKSIDNVLGYFLDNIGIWLTSTSGELTYYRNGTRTGTIRTGQIYARKLFAMSPTDTTFFYKDSLENNYRKDRCTHVLAQFYTFLDNDNDLVVGNLKISSLTNYQKAYILPGSATSNRIYNQNKTMTIQLGNTIYEYSINYSPLFYRPLFVDSLGYLDEITKKLSYRDTLRAFDLDDDFSYEFIENPINFTIQNDSILTLNTGPLGSYLTKIRVSDGKNYDTLDWITPIYSRKISITDVLETTITEDILYTQTITTTDIDNDSSDIYMSKLPSWLTISRVAKNQYKISGTPIYTSIDTIVQIIVTDNSTYFDAFQRANVVPSHDTLIYNIIINQVNDTPIVAAISNHSLPFNNTFSYQVIVTDEENGPLVYSFVESPTTMSITTTGLITWLPDFSEIGKHLISVRISDHSINVDRNFWIDVYNNNDAPVITSTPIIVGSENYAYSYQVLATDNEQLTYSLVEAPEQMLISTTGLITWTPNSLDTGIHHVIVKVIDIYDLFQTQEYDLDIQNINVAPVILSTLKDTTIIETDSIEFIIKAVDPDSTPITIKWYRNDEQVSTGSTFKMSSDYSSAGTYNIKVIVSDGELESEKTIKLTIKDKNRLPKVRTDTTIIFHAVDQTVTISSRALDPDNDVLIYSYDSSKFNVSNMVVEVQDSLYKVTLKGEESDTLSFIISDGKDSVSFNVFVIIDIPTVSVFLKSKKLINSFSIMSNGKISYCVAKPSVVQITISDLKGRILYRNVRTLNSGYYSRQVNVAMGTYVYDFKIGNNYSKTNKINFIKRNY
jgi:hypothetical protein